MMKRKNKTRVLPALTASLLIGAAVIGSWQYAYAQDAAENIALGKSVTFTTGRMPNYPHCTDPDDAKQITDGQFGGRGAQREVEQTNALWVQKGTVGWVRVYPTITIDLQTVQPISGVSFDTAAGISGVTWPKNIYVAVSDDNKSWRYIGDLATLSEKQPPAKDLAVFKYETHALRTKGRYVAIGVVNEPYVFVDEIEVYRGDAALLSAPAGGTAISDMAGFLTESSITSRARRRLDADIAGVRAEAAALDAPRRSAINAQLDALADETKNMAMLPGDTKTILPLNDTHRKILALHAEVLAAQNFRPLTAWTQPRYAHLPLLATPPKNARPALSFSMLRNQHRSQALLLTNAGKVPKTISLKLRATPTGARSDWLDVSSVAWTDTKNGIPVADALLPLTPINGVYQVEVPAGMTRKIWLTIDSSKLPAADTGSTLEVRDGAAVTTVPLTISIAKIAMPTPRLSLGMWDYTNNNGFYGISLRNRMAAIALMRSHYVDTPWANPYVLPFPTAADFDANGNLTKPRDFALFDQWVALWPGARHYFVFVNLSGTFAGAEIGTPEYSQRLGAWAKALSAHMIALKLQPQQLGLMLIDEPRMDSQDELLTAMTRIIKAAAPGLTLFSDPIWERPDQVKYQDAITKMDVLSPHLSVYKKGGEPVQQYFEKLRKDGKTLWIYQTSGSARVLSPQLYYRYAAWNAFAMGATGQGYWAFGDSSGAPTSWQSYLMVGDGYEPAFLDTDTVYNSLHWDAVREGIEDYEELAMLRDAIAASKNQSQKAQAQQVLDSAVQAVTKIWSDENGWEKDTQPELADAQLAKVRAMLVHLRG